MSEANVGAAQPEALPEATESFARRIEALEFEQAELRSRARMLTFGVAGLAVALVLALALGASGALSGWGDEMVARRFVLVGPDGAPRGVFEVAEEGTPRLVLRDPEGRDRMRLTLLEDGSPGIMLADRKSTPRLVLGVLPDQGANLVLADAAGQSRAVLGLGPDESVGLLLTDREGAARASLGVSRAGQPDFAVFEDVLPAPVPSEPDSAGAAAAPGP